MTRSRIVAVLAVAVLGVGGVASCGGDDDDSISNGPAVCPHEALADCGEWAAEQLNDSILWPDLDEGWLLLGANSTQIDSGRVVTAVLDNGDGEVLSLMVSSKPRDLSTDSTLSNGLRYQEVRPTAEGVDAVVFGDEAHSYTLLRDAAMKPNAPISRELAREVLDSLRSVTHP